MRRFALLLCGLVAWPMAARAQLTINATFDHASLASGTGNLTNINLTGRTNYFGEWRWMYFKASGVIGAKPTFTITQNFAGDSTAGPHELRDHEFVYSYDNEHWNFFDNNVLLAESTDKFQFSNSSAFTSNDVWIAYAIPYSYGRSVAHTQAVIASPWAAPTPSAINSSGVIGQTRAATDDIGRSIPALDLYGYRITDPSTDSPTVPKRKVGLSSGLHSGETLGTHTFQGLIDWLISDDSRAQQLRKIAEFYVYPVLNPSGRFAGMSRTTVADPTHDPNGFWNENTWNTNARQDIRVTGLAMINDVFSTPGGGLDAFIDFHSTVPDYANPTGLPHDFGFVDAADSNTDWWKEVQRLMNGNLIEYTTSGSGDFTTTGFARRKLGAKVEITVETQFTWERNVDYYHDLGKNFGVAFYNSWVPEPATGWMVVAAAIAMRPRAGRS